MEPLLADLVLKLCLNLPDSAESDRTSFDRWSSYNQILFVNCQAISNIFCRAQIQKTSIQSKTGVVNSIAYSTKFKDRTSWSN